MSEVVEATARRAPDLVCVTSVAPGGASHVRHLCRKLQQAQPALRILVLRLEPGSPEEVALAGDTITASSLKAAALRIEQACLLESSCGQPVHPPLAAVT